MSSMSHRWTVREETRKGPWMEVEDLRLSTIVGLMGDRRWDTVARVSGLRRTGKSCRLRWMNYLRPDLKRGRMSVQEEHLVLQLHARWGNKWSKIARKLPGRTDNEIKNYWRTHLRKGAQERTGHASPSPSLSTSTCSCKQSLTDSIENNKRDNIQGATMGVGPLLQDFIVENQSVIASQVPSLDSGIYNSLENSFDASLQLES